MREGITANAKKKSSTERTNERASELPRWRIRWRIRWSGRPTIQVEWETVRSRDTHSDHPLTGLQCGPVGTPGGGPKGGVSRGMRSAFRRVSGRMADGEGLRLCGVEEEGEEQTTAKSKNAAAELEHLLVRLPAAAAEEAAQRLYCPAAEEGLLH